MTRSNWIDTHFDFAGAAKKYAAAFTAFGLEVTPEQIEELARRIRAEQPAYREALILALDDWRIAAAYAEKVDAKTAELGNLVRASRRRRIPTRGGSSIAPRPRPGTLPL